MINHEQKPYLSLRDSIASLFQSKSSKEEFWALKDVCFNVMPGDTLGIIGKNGAGKSTLLKILSKITPPTSGKIRGSGRIASLLEVGTGFHPELSGRENIFMNGSILGMRRVEIQKNFDAIIDFSGVEKFIDTPLKHYSSGMQLRLAFAVAAFLENEILIIDEVLAVGDAEFQKKCIGKMEDVSKSGRTILFVSHQLSAIDALCNKGIELRKGKLIFSGTAKATIDHYLNSAKEKKENSPDHQCISGLKISSRQNGNSKIQTFDDVVIEGTLNLENTIGNATIGLVIRNVFNVPVLAINNSHYGIALNNMKSNCFTISLFELPLVSGTYHIDIFIGDGLTDHYVLENITEFIVEDLLPEGIKKAPNERLNTFIVGKTDWKLN